MANRPTESASHHFEFAERAATSAAQFLDKGRSDVDFRNGAYDQAVALTSLARGLKELATGLRATYMLLEEVKSLLDRPR